MAGRPPGAQLLSTFSVSHGGRPTGSEDRDHDAYPAGRRAGRDHGGGAVPSFAAAAAPPNDSRDSATQLTTLPERILGTTAGATVDPTDPGSNCAAEGGSVWYLLSVGATAPRQIAIQVEAQGELDASVDVDVKDRSQTQPVTCQRTDKHGEAVFAYPAAAHGVPDPRRTARELGERELLPERVRASAAGQPSRHAAAAGGASGSLARVVEVSQAYSAPLTAGVSYAVNLVSRIEGCMGLSIFPPDTKSFDASPASPFRCEGYRLFTPRVSGRYSFLVQADGGVTGRQAYHVQIARATATQTTPGVPLPNYAKAVGRLSGNHVGVVRLYRFDVTARSDLQLNLTTGAQRPFDLQLRSESGRILDCSCGDEGSQTITATTKPGRYYVAIKARDYGSGRFTLLRRSRAITQTSLRIDGERYVVRPPGDGVTVSLAVSAHADGPASVEIDRFDPVSGWQYNRTVKVRVSGGRGSFTFTPPSTGQWLMRASFLGSHGFSPSESRGARVLSAGPLSEVLG